MSEQTSALDQFILRLGDAGVALLGDANTWGGLQTFSGGLAGDASGIYNYSLNNMVDIQAYNVPLLQTAPDASGGVATYEGVQTQFDALPSEYGSLSNDNVWSGIATFENVVEITAQTSVLGIGEIDLNTDGSAYFSGLVQAYGGINTGGTIITDGTGIFSSLFDGTGGNVLGAHTLYGTDGFPITISDIAFSSGHQYTLPDFDGAIYINGQPLNTIEISLGDGSSIVGGLLNDFNGDTAVDFNSRLLAATDETTNLVWSTAYRLDLTPIDTPSAPAYQEGAVYYNSTLHKLMLGEASANVPLSSIVRKNGTLSSGTATVTVASGARPWVQDTGSSITNVGSLQVSVSGTTATVRSTNILDASTFDLFYDVP